MTDWTRGHEREHALKDDPQVSRLYSSCDTETSSVKHKTPPASLSKLQDPARTPRPLLIQLPVLPRGDKAWRDSASTPHGKRLRSGELDKADKTTVGRAILESTATACSKLIIDELNSF